MKKSTTIILLLAIFLIAFISRTMISFQTDKFSYESYFALRQIENINEYGVPLFDDPLSYGGRTHLFPPLFFYLISVFSFLGIGLAAKVIPNLLSALVIFVVYSMSFHITKQRSISLLVALFSGFIPIFFITINEVSVYSLVILLVLSVLYFIMRMENLGYLKFALFFIVLLVLSHASAFLLMVGLLLFLLLLKIESVDVSKKEKELILFISFFVLWFNFIIYKKALLVHGPLLIWQNIPVQILTNYFFDLNLVQSLYYIGIIPVIFGIYTIYYVLFQEKKKNLFLPLSLFLAVLVLLWFKLVSFNTGLIFLGLLLVILSSYSIKLLYFYLQKTKMPNSANWFLVVLGLIFALTTIIPSFNLAISSLDKIPSNSEIDAMTWLKENTPEDSIVLGRLEEGFLINYFANRKSVIDEDFLLVEDVQQRYDDVQSIYSLRLKSEAVRRLNHYEINYIYFSGKFGDEEKIYYADETCFEEVYNNKVVIYEVKCTI